MDKQEVVLAQLARMRGMTRYYHERFFSDTRIVVLLVLALLLIGWAGLSEAFLLVPVVALLGANQTAFDASYLYFARHYAASLEAVINRSLGDKTLRGAELEERYLFPLDTPKLVAVARPPGFTWFGWVTVFYTVLGILAFGAGLALGWETLRNSGDEWTLVYVVSLAALTLGSIGVGYWWFVRGEGERRLRETLEGLGGPQT
jgi:hypothetical protein